MLPGTCPWRLGHLRQQQHEANHTPEEIHACENAIAQHLVHIVAVGIADRAVAYHRPDEVEQPVDHGERRQLEHGQEHMEEQRRHEDRPDGPRPLRWDEARHVVEARRRKQAHPLTNYWKRVWKRRGERGV